ncbi:uncharacterized protein PgNI_08951 [Pyricularia grisea]|uniref:Uncharacterized protein n=1 Tax=Pyricularia grisea TaxID=148305 RepID=A0A6P8AW52_PYRGI|nr:uncharacterized protein PgNI_08951 [Pyricularia grisea]TLD06420.1 hypothetical protein PgNI_08951 [Pyricularia grisea]
MADQPTTTAKRTKHLILGEDGGPVVDPVNWDAEQILPLKDYPGAPEQVKKEAVHLCRGDLKVQV